jgi:hypothetical protein
MRHIGFREPVQVWAAIFHITSRRDAPEKLAASFVRVYNCQLKICPFSAAEGTVDAILAEWLSDVPHDWNYWRYLEDFTALREWYGSNKAEFLDAVDWLEEAEQLDSRRFHCKRFEVKFADWKRAYWTVEQAAALTFGKDPNLVTSAYALQEGVGPSLFAYYYKGIRDRILNAQADGRLGEPIRPRVYIEWAREAGISFSDELEEAAPERDDAVEDYKWLYRLANEDNERLRQENQRLQSDVAALSQQLNALDSLRTGAPGRPSLMHLVEAEHQRRASRHATETSVRKEAQSLAQWMHDTHPSARPLTAKTIENKIRARHRNPKNAQN